MFSNVRVNQQIFILDKANKIFEAGNVCEEPKMRYETITPQQQFNNPYYQQPMTVQVVDLKIQTPSGIQTVKGITANTNVFQNEAKTFFVTDDKDIMLNELKGLKTQSENHVKQTPYHQEMISNYENWIAMLSPDEAEKKQMAQRMSALEKSYAEQSEYLRQMIEQNRELMQQLTNKNDGERTKSSKNKEQ